MRALAAWRCASARRKNGRSSLLAVRGPRQTLPPADDTSPSRQLHYYMQEPQATAQSVSFLRDCTWPSSCRGPWNALRLRTGQKCVRWLKHLTRHLCDAVTIICKAWQPTDQGNPSSGAVPAPFSLALLAASCAVPFYGMFGHLRVPVVV